MNLSIPPEERYKDKKKVWYFHESSWYMRHNNGYDGQGCNNGSFSSMWDTSTLFHVTSDKSTFS
jgi:hypothetical protein